MPILIMLYLPSINTLVYINIPIRANILNSRVQKNIVSKIVKSIKYM